MWHRQLCASDGAHDSHGHQGQLKHPWLQVPATVITASSVAQGAERFSVRLGISHVSLVGYSFAVLVYCIAEVCRAM